MKGSLWIWWLVALAVVGVLMISQIDRSGPGMTETLRAGQELAARKRVCSEMEEAALWIAGRSRTPEDAVRITGEVIEEERFKVAGPKAVATVGGVVAAYVGRMPTLEIAAMVKQGCSP